MQFHLLRRSAPFVLVIMLVVSSLALAGGSLAAPQRAKVDMIEPKAGTWKTWVLKSGDQFRLAAPPDKAASTAEISQLKEMVGKRNAAALDQIAFWDTGSPSYRWNEIA